MTLEELLAECEKHGLKVTQPEFKKLTFAAIARYDRGLGAEYFNIDPFEDYCLAKAEISAIEAAEQYIKDTPGMEKALLGEVKVRPQ